MSASSLEHVLDALGRLKEFAGLRPDGYSTPYVAVHHDSNRIADHTSADGLLKKYEKESRDGGQSIENQYRSQGKSDVGVSKLERGGRITLPSKGLRPPEDSRLGKIISSYSGGTGTLRSYLERGSRDVVPDPYQVARKALRKHEVVHSILQQRRGGAPDTVSKLAGEEIAAYSKQLFGKKSPAKHLPVSQRIAKLVKGTIQSTVVGKKNLGITKWFEVQQAELDRARNRTDRNPTEAQKKIGNYRKGFLRFHGLPIKIENPRGSTRRGVSDDGTPWESEMVADYGYFATTKAADGDEVDCFLGPDLKSHFILAIDQYKGEAFDETKFILGTPNREEAEALYLKHYPAGWQLGPTSSTTTSQLKEWLKTGNTKKPFAGQKLKALASVFNSHSVLKEFAGLIPKGYHLPATWEHDEPDLLASYTDPRSIRKASRQSARDQKRPLRDVYVEAGGSDLGVSRMRRGGVINLPSSETQSNPKTHSGEDALHYGSRSVARRAYRRHEVAQSILQQRRGGPPDTVAKLAKEEAIAYSKQLFGKKSPASHLPLGMRIGKFLRGVPLSTALGKKSLGITKWFEELTRAPKGMKQFQRPASPEEERHELLKTGILSAGLAGGLALAGRGLRGTVGAAERVAIKKSVANKIASARRNARVASDVRAAEGAKAASSAAKGRYKAGDASFRDLAKNPNLTKGEKAAVKRTHSIWKSANPGKEFSERSDKLRDAGIGAGALAAGGGILHAGLKVGKAAEEVAPTARAIRAVLSHGEKAAGNLRKGWIGRIFRLSDARRPKRFALKTEENGIPYTGRVNRDRFVKQIHESDLDRRDSNFDRAAMAGSAAGWLTHGKGASLKQRLVRSGLGAAAGMGGVLAVRALTDKHRDIYGDRPRWAKRAESIPAVAGVGVAGALLAKKAKLFSAPSENPRKQEIKAALSGAASGALLGGGTALLTRGKSLKSALRAAGIGATAMGAMAGGGTAIGNKVLGNPDPNDRAAFTKRAAVGGALAGAALGGLGAVALKKGALGPKVTGAFAKGAKTWRPLHAIQTSGTGAAAAVGAGAGALYGAHQGADEGMMVDAINNSQIAARNQDATKKNLSAKVRGFLKEFGYSSQLREKDSQRWVSPTRAALGLHGDVVDASGNAASLAGIQTARGFYNKAKGVHRWGGRVGGLARDTGDVLAGRGRRTDMAGRPQRREWEKAWFHRTVGTAATAAAMLGGAALATKTGFGQKHIIPQIKKADAFTRKHGVSLFGAKLRRSLKQFDLDAALSGWDIRDPRGKSARVFAPGSRPRFRRPKEWHEKKENREALLKGAIVGTGLLGAGAGFALTRKLSGLSVIPKKAVVPPSSNIIRGVFPKKIA